jgi:hypothetical protein
LPHVTDVTAKGRRLKRPNLKTILQESHLQKKKENGQKTMKITRLTNEGLQTFFANEKSFMVFLSGKPISCSINELPGYIKDEIGDSMPEKIFGQKYLGNGKVLHIFRGNCANARPFQFDSIESAVEAFKLLRWEREGRKETAKVFRGNMWVGNIVEDEYHPIEPVMQLL